MGDRGETYLALASASSSPLQDTSSRPPMRCLKELQHRTTNGNKHINTPETHSQYIQPSIINTTNTNSATVTWSTTTATASSHSSTVHSYGQTQGCRHTSVRGDTLECSWSASLKDSRAQRHLHLPLRRLWLTEGFEMLRCWVPQMEKRNCICLFIAQCTCQNTRLSSHREQYPWIPDP